MGSTGPPDKEGTMGGTQNDSTLAQPSQFKSSAPSRAPCSKLQPEMTRRDEALPNSHTNSAQQNNSRREQAQSDTSNPTCGSVSSKSSTKALSSGSSSSPNPQCPLKDFVVPTDANVLVSPSLEDISKAIEYLKHQFASARPPQSQYLHVQSIPQAIFRRLQDDPDIFRGVRATISHHQAEILYKVMPGAQHEQIIGSFGLTVVTSLVLMGLSGKNGDFVDRRSARTLGITCSKEPDWWFGPYNWVNGGGDGSPSLILEVGLSEPSNQLRNDARWWHANTDRETKLVVLIHVSRAPVWTVVVEVWTEVNNPWPGPVTRAHPSRRIMECTQRAEYQNGVVQGAPLTLSFETMMHRPPQNTDEHDIILDADDLAYICAQTN